MYELFFYVGIVLCIACFLLAVFLFFSQNVIGAIKYFLKTDVKTMKKNNVNNNEESKIPVIVQNSANSVAVPYKQYTTSMNDATQLLNEPQPTEVLDNQAAELLGNVGATELLNSNEKTELLGVANFATALLDADSTTVLPDIYEEV